MKVAAYDILGEIGRGGMGAVYRARAADGRIVAVKLLLSHKARGSSSAIERFDRERRLLATLGEAEGFVPLLDHGVANGGPFLVMPFLGGGTLRARLRRGPLSVDEAIDLAVRLADALGHAHERGLVHRDLKPENILFTTDGRPLVSDLGLAKHFRDDVAGASASVSLSKTGEALGTAGYMPQEQLNDGKTAGPPADVFALGAMIYESLTGRGPFEGETAQERVVKVIEGRVAPLRNERPDVPRSVARAIEKALAAKAGDRYPDGRAFAEALRGATKAPAPSTRRTAVFALLAFVVVFGGAAGATALVLQHPRAEGRAAPDAPEPAKTPGDPPKPAVAARGPVVRRGGIPDVCSGFREGARAKLAAVFGTYAWKHTGSIQAVALSPDGKLAATGGDDHVIRLWDVATATEARILRGHTLSVIGLDFSPDGRQLLSASGDQTVRLWDVASGTELFATKRFPHQVWCAVFSPDAKRALAACRDGNVRLLDLENRGEVVRTLAGSGGIVPSCSFSPDGRLGAFGSHDGVRVYDLATGVLKRHYTAHTAGIDWAVWTPDGQTILSGGWDTTLRLWNVATGETIRTLQGHKDDVRDAVLVGDGKRLLTCSRDETVRLWDVATGRELWQKRHRGWVLSCAATRDGRRAITGSQDGTCRLWDLETPGGGDLTPEGVTGGFSEVALTPDGKHAITGGLDGTLREWDLADDAAPGRALAAHDAPISGVAVTPGGDRAVSVSTDGTFVVTGLKKGEALYRDTGERRPTSLALSSDGARALGGTDKGELVAWDLAKKTRTDLGSFLSTVVAVAFARDGAPMSACTDQKIRLWDADGTSVRDIVTLEEDDDVHAVAFFPDGRRALVAGGRTLRIRELTAEPAGRELARNARAQVVAVSGDGRRGLAAGHGKLTLWDLDGAKALETLDLESSADQVAAAAFGPGAKSLVVATRRGVLLRFELR